VYGFLFVLGTKNIWCIGLHWEHGHHFCVCVCVCSCMLELMYCTVLYLTTMAVVSSILPCLVYYDLIAAHVHASGARHAMAPYAHR
jgi:hypothetical protein